MEISNGERDIASIRLPLWGRVDASGGMVPWLVVDDDGQAVEPIAEFLREFVARGRAAGSVRSYAYALGRRAFSGQSLNLILMPRPADSGTRRGPLEGSYSRVLSGDVWNCSAVRCTAQCLGGRVPGLGTEYGGPARS